MPSHLLGAVWINAQESISVPANTSDNARISIQTNYVRGQHASISFLVGMSSYYHDYRLFSCGRVTVPGGDSQIANATQGGLLKIISDANPILAETVGPGNTFHGDNDVKMWLTSDNGNNADLNGGGFWPIYNHLKNNLIQKFNYLDPINPNSDAFTSATWHIDERTWTTAPSELILNYQGGQSGDDYAWYGFLFYSRELTSRFKCNQIK